MSRKKTTLVEPEDESEADFVSRWSRLKHEAAKDAEPAAAGNTAAGMAAENAELEQTRAPSTSILTDEDMLPIESLTADSDYADFLSPGVSEGLRKLALRKLFHGEAFNIRDGLDEYDDDFTQFEKLGDIVTSDMRHQVELEAQRKADQLLQHEDQSSDAADVPDLGMNNVNDESADSDMGVTAQSSAQTDGIYKAEEAESDNEVEDDTTGGEKTGINK